MSRLILVPWHIGDAADLSLNVLRVSKRLRVFLAEEPEVTRGQLESLFGIRCRDKEFLPIPESCDQEFLDRVLRLLESEDVGMCASGGVPCFMDPGAWLVREVRARGGCVVALAGASSLSTLLSVSGIEWGSQFPAGSFIFFSPRLESFSYFIKVIRREREPIVVFAQVEHVAECLRLVFESLGARPVSLFFDLATVPRGKFPYANEVLTRDCGQWLKDLASFDWERVGNLALLIHSA
ncbi:MAG: hypothetical protein HY921_07705 [Elusimicrobia bacterium]|nr:hypothetical protein [Elusimicrobiota bacterium]